MMGFGFLFMLLIIAVPIIGVVALVYWLGNANRQPGTPFSVNQSAPKREQFASPDAKRFCSHCGAGLQDDWTHCPQCGAPVGS